MKASNTALITLSKRCTAKTSNRSSHRLFHQPLPHAVNKVGVSRHKTSLPEVRGNLALMIGRVMKTWVSTSRTDWPASLAVLVLDLLLQKVFAPLRKIAFHAADSCLASSSHAQLSSGHTGSAAAWQEAAPAQMFRRYRCVPSIFESVPVAPL